MAQSVAQSVAHSHWIKYDDHTYKDSTNPRHQESSVWQQTRVDAATCPVRPAWVWYHLHLSFISVHSSTFPSVSTVHKNQPTTKSLCSVSEGGHGCWPITSPQRSQTMSAFSQGHSEETKPAVMWSVSELIKTPDTAGFFVVWNQWKLFDG